MSRSYAQHCGLALSLDLLGERWTLLVVRELALGPKRFGDLERNLPGIGTNLLSARLHRLEEAGVARRSVLPPPANVRVYELTERGEALRPALEHLALWGLEMLPERPGAAATRASWAAMSLGAIAANVNLDDVSGSFAFEVEDERFALTLDGGELVVREGAPATSDVTVTTSRDGFFALATGALSATAAVRLDLATVDGDPTRLDALLERVHLPARPR